MAIKGGQIIHVGNGVAVVDRVQSGGPGQLNIPTEKINELGNYKSVATVRDTPDLSFSLESFDVSSEVEQIVTGQDGAARTVADAGITTADTTLTSATAAFTSKDVGRQVVIEGAGAAGADLITTIETVTDASTVEVADPAGATVAGADASVTPVVDLSRALPIDIASQFKAGLAAADPFKVTASVALPFLYLEQMTYRFGLRDNATQSATLRGDSIFYNPGPAFVEKFDGTGVAAQVIVTTHPAYQVAEGTAPRILSVTVGDKRLARGPDYSEVSGVETAGAAVVTLTLVDAVPVDEEIRIVYSSPDVVTYPQSVHPDVAVKPAAVKGRDIEIYAGDYDPNDPTASGINKLTSVQSINLDYRVTIEKDEEFGNYYSVGLDFGTPTVNGSVDIKPRDTADFLQLLRKFAGVTDATKIIGTATSVPIPLHIVIKNPENGETLKRLFVEDARFTPPGYTGRVEQQTTVTVNFESDEGNLLVFPR